MPNPPNPRRWSSLGKANREAKKISPNHWGHNAERSALSPLGLGPKRDQRDWESFNLKTNGL